MPPKRRSLTRGNNRMRILHRALPLLFRMHFVAFFRRLAREMKTLRGAFTLIFYLCATLWWIPFFLLGGGSSSDFNRAAFYSWFEEYREFADKIPGIVLFTLCLSSVVLPIKKGATKTPFVNKL